MLFQGSSAFSLASILALAAGQAAPAGHEYIPPGPNDVRSPCPGINSAANHGYIPRSGKNITPLQVAQGLKEGLNVGLDFGLVVGQGATLSNPNPLAGTFNMDQLRAHNFPIEHDVSLSRQDFYQGNNLNFNQDIFNQVLAFYEGMERTSFPRAMHAQWARVDRQRQLNGDRLIYGPRQLVLGLVESSLYQSVMGNPITGEAPISYVRSFFEQERLPYELGWTKPAVETNLATLGIMANNMLLTDPGEFGEQLPELTGDLIQDVFQLRDPLTGTLVNATCALLGRC
ncbi:hypothetical protein CKM354_000455300 [Cercospora kikuchii]|uniref:Heme haloperoxidase family profile domain-containing protein n=1 Tax=Cercospora kikuchii TaxID=84275 RepID=A0A9P3CIT0_9PEZI|nr:uncharacterized protein CKM354_000455300 [Cercospora kikuchii]GIZ41240.1 hypothetical protein CKM354_000455300 [Cercospora kikuchii]